MSPIKADVKLFENNEGNQTEGQIWAEGKAGLGAKMTEPTEHHLKLFKQSWKAKLGQMK